MSIAAKIRQAWRNADLATKIALNSTLGFVVLLLVVNAVTYFGLEHILYGPAESTIRYSMSSTAEVLDSMTADFDGFDPESFRKPLVTGVVMRVFDGAGDCALDTDPNYPSNEIFEAGILTDRPFFAADDMDISEIGNALVYRAELDYDWPDAHLTLYFFRTITSKQDIIAALYKVLMALGLGGIFLSMRFGRLLNREVLRPVKVMTAKARAIAFGKMGERIAIPAANDELAELARTFNGMLDRIQGGIAQQQKFVLNASHELINPATAIFGAAEILKNYGRDDAELFDEQVATIFAEVKHIDNILQNLLLLAQIDQNSQKLHKENLELSNIVAEAVETAQILAPERSVELSENASATIFGDDNMIRQLIRIFLENAAKATDVGGRIEVAAIRAGGEVRLNVADDGAGIAPENLGKLFDRDASDSSGNWLGMAIAKWIADNHGIKIEFESALGRGTTVTLVIPCK